MKKINIFLVFILLFELSFSQEPAVFGTLLRVEVTVQENPNRVTLRWDPVQALQYPTQSIRIDRRNIENTYTPWFQSSWPDPQFEPPYVLLPNNATEFVDNNVVQGQGYEYKITVGGSTSFSSYLIGRVETFVCSGVRVAPIENRGKIILLIDSTLSQALRNELKTLEQDLVGDGWQVIRHTVLRFGITPPQVKQLIINDYNSDPLNVKAVYIIGHIAVPYSGNINPDGHNEHRGAWPADIYYGDVVFNVATDWTDVSVNNTSAAQTRHHNVPGDGKFDQSGPVSRIELEVGRIDFYNLPAFTESELDLTRNYLQKSHRYKHKTINPDRKFLIDDNFNNYSFSKVMVQTSSSLFGKSNCRTGDYFTDMRSNSYIMSYGNGAGFYNSCQGVGTTVNFAQDTTKTIFSFLFGSYFGDWDNGDDFLRSSIATTKGWNLVAGWNGRPEWLLHHMGLGYNIGFSARLTQTNKSFENNIPQTLYGLRGAHSGYYGFTHVSMLGDPSLRLHNVFPAANLNAVVLGKKVQLSWSSSADNAILGYYIYRQNPITKSYSRITPSPIVSNSFIDNNPNTVGSNVYMVRAVKLENGTGSYINLSQGIFDTLPANITSISALQSTRVVIDSLFKTDSYSIAQPSNENIEVHLFPNPASSDITISFRNENQENFEAILYNSIGCRVMSLNLKNSNYIYENVNISSLSKGLYFIEITSPNEKIIKRWIRN